MGMANAKILVASMSKRHGITESKAVRMIYKYIRRAQEQHFAKGWWVDLMDAQFQTHIGVYKRIRCGQETGLSHLVPEEGRYCHDCGCAIGEYHVFGCDSEECSNCGEQAFCCDCDDGLSDDTKAE